MCAFNSKVTSWLDKTTNRSDLYSEQFCENFYEFLDFLIEINEYIGVTSGKHPVEPMFVTIGKPIVKTALTNKTTRDNILDHIMDKISRKEVFSAILEKDVKKLSTLAHTIFDDLPTTIVDNIVKIINSDHLDDETYDNVFEYIEHLGVNLLKHKLLLANENDTIDEFVTGKHSELLVAMINKF